VVRSSIAVRLKQGTGARNEEYFMGVGRVGMGTRKGSPVN